MRAVAALFVGSIASCSSSHPISPGTQSGAPWPAYRHDEGLTGRSAVTGARTSNVRWKLDTGAFVGTASPSVAADGTIYVGNSAGSFIAARPDGSTAWTKSIGAVESAPVVALDGSIYVGSDDASIHVYSPSGGEIARMSGTDSISSRLVVDDGGTAYFFADKRACAAPRGGDIGCGIDATAFALAGARLYRDGYSTDIEAYTQTPVDWTAGALVAQGALAAVEADGTTFVFVNGRIESHDPSGAFVWACDVPSGDDVAVVGPTAVYVAYGSTLYAAGPGKVAWSLDVGAPISSALAIDAAGVAYFGAMDGALHAVDATGRPLFTVTTGGPVRSSPAIGADGTVFFGSDDGMLYAVGP